MDFLSMERWRRKQDFIEVEWFSIMLSEEEDLKLIAKHSRFSRKDCSREYMPKFIGIDDSPEAKKKNERQKITRLYTKTCLYAVTKDESIVASPLPGYPHITIAFGSGHAYKFASFLGLALSQIALQGSTPYDLSALRIERPELGLQRLTSSEVADYQSKTRAGKKSAM